MPATSYNLHGVHILAFAADGKKLQSDRDAVEFIGEAFQQRAGMVLIPAERFEDDFFRLGTRIAGEIIQKSVTYKLRLAILGDLSRHLGESSSLRDFVRECNRGSHVWFVANLEELEQKLKAGAGEFLGTSEKS